MNSELTILRPTDAPPATVSIRDILTIFFRQRRVILVCFFGVLLAGLFYSLFSARYQAHMRVLVRRSRMDPVVTASPEQSLLLQQEFISEEQLNSEAELLRDQEMIRSVVTSLGLARSPEWAQWLWPGTEGQRTEAAVRRAATKLNVTPIRKTNLIEVSYSAAGAEQASAFLQTLGRAYLDRHQRVRRPSGQFQFFDQQVNESRASLTRAEYRMLDFMRGQGVVSASLERDSTLQKLSEAENNNRQTQVALTETARKVRSLETRLKTIPDRITTSTRLSGNPELMARMKSRLLELQLKRSELLTKFEPGYRLVQEVDQQIKEAKDSIAAEQQAPILEQTTDQNPDYAWARAEMLKSQVELDALMAHAQATGVEVAGYRDMARFLGEHAIVQDDLVREMKSAEGAYLLYVSKREEARIADALDAGGILNVTVAEQPSVPALPARSSMNLLAISFVVASAFSTGAALVADRLDPAFRTPDEVFAVLHTPVLAFLPAGTEGAPS
jgi:uncharacterized protein involved in exopolysaccharide biosynthesis